MNEPRTAHDGRRTKWRWPVIAVALIGAVVAALAFALYPRQPTYQGKSVDGWLKEVFNFQASGINRQAQALQALRAMGPKAVPFQIEALAGTDARFGSIYRTLFRKMAPKVQKFLPPPTDHRAMRFAASVALQNNDETKKFMPAIVRLLQHENADVRVEISGLVVEYISAEDKQLLPAMIPALRDPDARVRKHMVYAFAAMERGAEAAVPELMKALEDSDPEVREGARKALQRIRPRAETPR